MNTIKLKQYVVDAFTDTVFKGNPAAICVLDRWLPDHVMQSITKENNLSETASPRSGVLYCRMEGERVILAGKAALYAKAEITVPEEVAE